MESRVTIFAGHYGSGKTTLAVNYARMIRQRREKVTLCDLDIVNPYFRTADAAQSLQEEGIALISSRLANTNMEAPALPPETKAVLDDRDMRAVIDLGGDDRGALALGRYARRLREEGDYEMLLVFNVYRPLTRSVPALSEIRTEIETAGKVPFTGLVNNSNLGFETAPDHIFASFPFAGEASSALGLPLRMTAVPRALLDDMRRFDCGNTEFFPVDMYTKSNWKL